MSKGVDFNGIVNDFAAAQARVAPAPEPWRYCNQACLGFEGGSLLIKPDGSGSFAFNEAEVGWERDEESGKDIIIAKFPAGEAQELRDYLNKWFPAQAIDAPIPHGDTTEGDAK